VFYVERGGKLSAKGVWLTHSFQNGPTLLRVGGAGGAQTSTTASPIVIENVVFDAPGSTMKLLEMDTPGDPNGDIVFRDVAINVDDYDVPIVTVKEGFHVTLDNVNPLTPGSIRLLDENESNFTPSATIANCVLKGLSSADNPQEIIDDDGSTPGTEVRFIGCTEAGGATETGYERRFCRDGVWVVGTGWKTGAGWE
jgi:hypothetical protein